MIFGRNIRPARNDAGLSKLPPPGNTPDGSTGVPASLDRQCPTASKFSSANPKGSIMAWQPAHAGFLRCCSKRARTDVGCPWPSLSFNDGTFGGGGGGGVPRMFSRSHFPRTTGDVRFAYDVTMRMLPCPRTPARLLSTYDTRRNWLPDT